MSYRYYLPGELGWRPSPAAHELARQLVGLPAEDVANALWLINADMRIFVKRIASRLPTSIRIERAARAGGRACVAKHGRAHLDRLLAVGRTTRWRSK